MVVLPFRKSARPRHDDAAIDAELRIAEIEAELTEILDLECLSNYEVIRRNRLVEERRQLQELIAIGQVQ